MERNERVKFIGGKVHKYFVDGVPMRLSVTTLIKQYFEEFDKPAVAEKMIANPNFYTDKKYARYWPLVKGLSTEDAIAAIVKSWSESTAADEGTAMHNTIDEFYSNNTPVADTPELQLWKRYHNDKIAEGYVLFKSEMFVYDEEYSVGGSADMLWTRPEWLDQTPIKVVLADWKRTKQMELRSFYNPKLRQRKMGLELCANIEDCNYQHYNIQLNIYRYLLEKHYNLKVVKSELVVLYPDNPCPLIFPVGDMQELVKEMLEAEIST